MIIKPSSVFNWVMLAITLSGAAGTGIWWAATLTNKVDTMRDDIAYIKDRIDGMPSETTAATAATHERTGRRP
jgi:hypothetical protein